MSAPRRWRITQGTSVYTCVAADIHEAAEKGRRCGFHHPSSIVLVDPDPEKVLASAKDAHRKGLVR